jgi:hypothetical protein
LAAPAIITPCMWVAAIAHAVSLKADDFLKALTQMVRRLRRGSSRNGLVLANGGVCTYQHVICLSSQPRKDGSPYPATNPLPAVITDVPVPTVVERAEGEAVIEVGFRVFFHVSNTDTRVADLYR